MAKAAALLREGKLVGIPTETVYGLAANALNPEAISSIYAVKNRPSFNPLILHIANAEEAEKYALSIPKLASELMKHFWPGPLSILLPKSDLVPDLVTAGSEKVVLRVPNHPLTLRLLSEVEFPLAAPSANMSNTVSPTSASHVQQGLGEKISYILDGRSTIVGLESTIIEVIGNEIFVLRDGGITREELEKFGEVRQMKSTKQVQSPGQLSKHYSTRKPLLLVEDIEAYISMHPNKIYSVLLFEEKEINATKHLLSKDYDLAEIANNLFGKMREADEDDSEAILVEPIQEVGIGRAVADRLKRASVKN